MTGGYQDAFYDLLDSESTEFVVFIQIVGQVTRFKLHFNVDVVELLSIWREKDCVNFSDLTFLSALKFTNG